MTDLKKKVLYLTCRKLCSLIENYIMEEVTSPSPESYGLLFKKHFSKYVVKYVCGFFLRYGSN